LILKQKDLLRQFAIARVAFLDDKARNIDNKLRNSNDEVQNLNDEVRNSNDDVHLSFF